MLLSYITSVIKYTEPVGTSPSIVKIYVVNGHGINSWFDLLFVAIASLIMLNLYTINLVFVNNLYFKTVMSVGGYSVELTKWTLLAPGSLLV